MDNKLIIIIFIGLIFVNTNLVAQVNNTPQYEEYEKKSLRVHTIDFKEGIYYINKAIELNPLRIQSYLSRGIIYAYRGMKDDNKKYLSQAWNDFSFYIHAVLGGEVSVSKKNFAGIYAMRGSLSFHEKSYSQGMDDYKKACELDNSSCEVYFKMRNLLSN